jgi:hypothetical protein
VDQPSEADNDDTPKPNKQPSGKTSKGRPSGMPRPPPVDIEVQGSYDGNSVDLTLEVGREEGEVAMENCEYFSNNKCSGCGVRGALPLFNRSVSAGAACCASHCCLRIFLSNAKLCRST